MPRVLPHASRSVLGDVETIAGDAVALPVSPAPLAVRIAGAAIEFIMRIALQIRLYVCLSQVMEGASRALWGATEEDILAEHYRRERQRLRADAALTARLFPNRRSADTHL